MKIISPEEYRAILKETLKEFHEICVRNGLRYFAAYGTLIGAIRHEGFIPWDDEVDVCMTREDLEKLVGIMDEEDGQYYMVTPAKSKNYYNAFSRFCSKKGILRHKKIIEIENLGPYLNVFPLDKVPEDPEERLEHYREVGKYQKLLRYSLPLRLLTKLRFSKMIAMVLLDRAIRKAALRTGTKIFKNKRDELLIRYNQTDSGVLFPASDDMTDDQIVMADEIEPLQLHAFEDIEVYVPAEYDAILRRCYGDYMVLPPEKERVSRQYFIAYWK